MGEAIGGLPETPALREGPVGLVPPDVPAGADPIGAYLSRQRRLRGLSLEELGSLTRIPLRSLERLEAGAFDRDPDGFARGFVRTVATAIGLDPDETVARMLVEVAPESRVSGLPLRAALAALLGAVLLAGLGLAAAALRDIGSGADDSAPAAVHRRDAVRGLAIEAGPPVGESAAAPGD